MENNEIILYQPDSTLKLDVRVEDETVWLTQLQMAELFQATKQNISFHISNIYKDKEISRASTVKEYLTVQKEGSRRVQRKTNFYNLDVIISVGYRVKSVRGVQFRQWANKILKEYLLRGYSVNQRLLAMDEKMDRRFFEHDRRLDELSNKVDFFVRTSLPPVEGVFFNGQIFDAYLFVSDLVKRAKSRIILIDNYVDETVLSLLDKRKSNVEALIYTRTISGQFQLDIEKHNSQYRPILVERATQVHDRFLIIDDTLYHLGASIKDLGKKLFAFSKMEANPEFILKNITME
ncbi:MAG: virulence RhuM family protein [Bacteroides sp.]|nr:virulence RhuM family protein [Ruminococcus flavefaciens]MCM1555053.1 virulence RhuM family protein [Bacteroides sp.]MCM1555496.1 virulence RhuM family protein [Bacteroides sp.]